MPRPAARRRLCRLVYTGSEEFLSNSVSRARPANTPSSDHRRRPAMRDITSEAGARWASAEPRQVQRGRIRAAPTPPPQRQVDGSGASDLGDIRSCGMRAPTRPGSTSRGRRLRDCQESGVPCSRAAQKRQLIRTADAPSLATWDGSSLKSNRI